MCVAPCRGGWAGSVQGLVPCRGGRYQLFFIRGEDVTDELKGSGIQERLDETRVCVQATLWLLQCLSINPWASGKGQVLPQQFLGGAGDSAFPASFQQKLTLLEEDHKDGERWKAGGVTERSI